jgi:hypothetical protein
MKIKKADWIFPLGMVIIPVSLACSLLHPLPAFRDGCYLGTAKSWIDENENGIWDTHEQPLEGVALELTDGQRDDNYLYDPLSDENGEFFLSIFPNTCESLESYAMVLRAIPPHGYQATTPAEIRIPTDELLDSELHDYHFGFIRQIPEESSEK